MDHLASHAGSDKVMQHCIDVFSPSNKRTLTGGKGTKKNKDA